MTIKYLIVESNLQNAELCARELFQKGLISKHAEWRWIPFGKEFRNKATGWYSSVEHDDVKVCGLCSKESFLRMYVETLTT